MATPSSSTTTPSPQLRYIQPNTVVSPTSLASNGIKVEDKEERERAVQKFIARAEMAKVCLPFLSLSGRGARTRSGRSRPKALAVLLVFYLLSNSHFCLHLTSTLFHAYDPNFLLTAPFRAFLQLTRALRTRLSYASFKAMNNLTHTTLHDLETQSSHQLANPRLGSGKASANHYANPAMQGSSTNPTSSSKQASRKGPMAPPPTTASAAQSLFTSILAPPPTKRVRTIHNPDDPPVPAPEKGKPSTPLKKPPKSPRTAEGAHGHARGKKDARSKVKEKGKAREVERRMDTDTHTTDGDIDMKAAATLTSLLLARPSISGGASSPRSSVSGGSDTGSTQSFAHFAQSSARTITAATSSLSSAESSLRARTPSPRDRMQTDDSQPSLSQGRSVRVGSITPKLQHRTLQRTSTASTGTPHPPSDTEAADSLLWLATSPSPVRPTTVRDRDSADVGGLRSLGGGGGLRGRVLFPLTHEPSGDSYLSPKARSLKREGTGSFASTATAVTDSGGDGGGGVKSLSRNSSNSPSEKTLSRGHGDQHRKFSKNERSQVPMEPTVIPPTPVDLAPPGLLPAPPSPPSHHMESSYSRSSSHPAPSDLPPGPTRSSTGTFTGNMSNSDRRLSHPSTPGLPFNFSDFINVSPSPAVASSGSLSLRPAATTLPPTVGRRLFEEHHRLNGSSGAVSREEGVVQGRRGGLGAGIDLVQS